MRIHEDLKSKTDLLEDGILQNALELIGTSAFGVQYIQLGGFTEAPVEWFDPVYKMSNPSKALNKLTDQSDPEFFPQEEALTPGVGLLGTLWNDVNWDFKNILLDRRMAMRQTDRNYVLRDLEALASDPDTPYDHRLKLLVEAGIGQAIGIPFNINNDRGLVIFGFRHTVDISRLQSSSNIDFLQKSASFLGSVNSYRSSYHIAKSERKKEANHARMKLRASVRDYYSFQDLPKAEATATAEKTKSLNDVIKIKLAKTTIGKRVLDYFKKWLGAETTKSPTLSTYHSIFCFFGTFISCLIWGIIDKILKVRTKGNYVIERGSYGSLVAAQYLLIASPAAQPSNAMISQILCGVIAISINYIPKLPPLFRIAFTPALVNLVMGKTGFIHPTTGGEALFYAYTGVTDWELISVILFNYLVGIVIAVVINNLSVDRQYPTYWFPTILRVIKFPRIHRAMSSCRQYISSNR